MRKVSLLSIILVVILLVSGCSNGEKLYYTFAVPFSKEQMKTFEVQKSIDDYHSENLQAFEKSDGSKVIYLYSAPIEQSGNSIENGNESFQCNGTYYNKFFPKTLSNKAPIVIGDSDNFVKIYFNDEVLSGKLLDSTNAFGVRKQAIIYEDAFNQGEDYVCYPTSFGVNSEIIINKRSDTNKYQIKIQLPNLAPESSSPDYILFKTALEKGNVKSILYTPLVVDNNGKWSYLNSVKLIDKDAENNIYTVEYEIDKDFLNDKKTKFPVVMNQSIYLYKSKQPDTSAYEKTGDVASHYLSPYILLGDKTLKGEGWTYVRFETLNNLYIEPEKIVSAKYIFHNLFDLKKEAKVAAYAVTADWCSKNTRWFNRPPFDDKPISEVNIKKAGDYKLDITSLLMEMIKNKGEDDATYSIQNSFMIRSDTKESNVIISSGDNGVFSPVLEIVLSE